MFISKLQPAQQRLVW